ncbi:MAG: hypothetical protein GF307_10150 [candidate division Zixibacteria bacterium]|nr:hypothetical protein [candidate division Zixibacteria bacterium]
MGDGFRKVSVLFKVIVPFIALSIISGAGVGVLSQTLKKDKEEGKFTFVDGKARKQKIGAEKWQEAEENTPVETGDRVKTLIRTRAEIKLEELDIIRLAPKTTIDVLKLYKEGKDKKRESEIEVQEGDIWANIGSLDASSSLDLNTAVANATVKGTVFRVNVGEDSTTELKVYKGEVDVSGKTPVTEEPEKEEKKSGSLAPKQIQAPKQVEGPKEVTMKEWTYIVREMQKIVISADKKVMYHGEFSSEDKDEQTDWVEWNRQRDKNLGLQVPSEEKPDHGPPMKDEGEGQKEKDMGKSREEGSRLR